jgi:4-hydroxy-tetrahydrodipicolinate synthase
VIERTKIRGVIPPIVTPLHADGETVNEPVVHQLVDSLIRQGVHGIFVGGTTGEVWTLDDEQWKRMLRAAVTACKGRVPLYAGVSSSSTGKAVRRVRMAEELGADVAVSLAPYYVPAAQSDIVRHFEALAAASSLPVLVYQFPTIVKVSITLDTYVRLMAIPGVFGIKDSQVDVTEFRRMVEVLRGGGQDARLFLGSDALTDVTVMLGGQGTVPTLGNIAAPWLVEAYEAAVAGDWKRSAAAQSKANALKKIYKPGGKESFFRGVFAGIKCALNLLGFEVGPTAPPMLPCDQEETRAIETILREEGLLD